MKILTVCPVKKNSIKLARMLDTHRLTKSKFSEHVLVFKGTVTESINYAFKQHPNCDYYHITNDDVEYKTPLWDLQLARAIDKNGISYGNDGLQGQHLCTFPMISGNIVRKLGWLQLPTLNKYCGDVVWHHLGREAECLHYVPNVEIEHHWEGVSDPDINIKDMGAYADWLPYAFRDVAKVKEVLNAAKS